MKVTDVRVRKVDSNNRMKAVASITLDDEFVVHDIKVIEGEKGLFIAMPSKKSADGEYRDIAHPINSATRDVIQKTILESYEKALLEPDEEVQVYINVGQELRAFGAPLFYVDRGLTDTLYQIMDIYAKKGNRL